MQPTPSDVHVSVPLTNISIAYVQDASAFVADTVFPNIPVSKQADRYWTYDRGMFNRDEMQIRAPSTESAGGGYTLDNTPSYYCPVYAFHKDVPDEVRSNADNPLNLDREATIFITQKALIKREKTWVSRFFAAGVWTTDVTGVAASPGTGDALRWDDANSTPIENIREAKRLIRESTGFEPNVLVLGRAVKDALADHPDLVDRIKYGQTPNGPAMVNMQAMAALFEVDRIVVSNAIENTAVEGATNSHGFIAGKHALLAYAAPAPGLMTPSAGYTFSWTGHMGATAQGWRIMNFRAPLIKSDRVEIEMAYEQKVIGADLGYFWNGIVA
jgi:hypothetical protein